MKTAVIQEHIIDVNGQDNIISNNTIKVADFSEPSTYYHNLYKYKDYFYRVTYDSLNYEYASRYFRNKQSLEPMMACTSLRSGQVYGRNLDLYYNYDAKFWVHVTSSSERFESWSLCRGIDGLTEQFVSSHKYSEAYQILPFYVMDGINEHSVVCNINVVPLGDKPGSDVSYPEEDCKVTIATTMVCRYILDHFTSAREAVYYLKKHAKIFTVSSYDSYTHHFMVADVNDTFVLEIVNNHLEIITHNVLTNFYISGAEFNNDGTVYTPKDVQDDPLHNPMTVNKITSHGCGLERYNYGIANLSESTTMDSMRSTLDYLRYGRSYYTDNDPADPRWDTEFVGLLNAVHGGVLTPGTPSSDFEPTAEYASRLYLEGRKPGTEGTWKTLSSIVYNIPERYARIIVDEDDEEIELPCSSTDDYSTCVTVSYLENNKLIKKYQYNSCHIEYLKHIMYLVDDASGLIITRWEMNQ